MCDNCACCSGRAIEKATGKNSFPKRLLVAVSVVILLGMCLTPVDARSVEHRRRHHGRPENVAQLTKDETMKRPKSLSTEQYRNATRKIKHKLRNTKRFFDQDQKILNETKEYRDGKPTWLPAVNFVDIHFHDYRTLRRAGKSITERKFAYLMPKLHKTLKEYEVIFKRLQNVQVESSDNPFANYIVVRQKLLSDTLDKLYSTIAEIQENMVAVKMQIPTFDETRMKLDKLETNVGATQCLKNDYIAFRGYGNLLTNWYSEFRCPLNKRNDKKCAMFHAKMKVKLNNKRFKNNRNNVPMTS